MKSDNSQSAITWPDSLDDLENETPAPARTLNWKRKLAYALLLGGVFWLGVLLITLHLL